MREIKFRAWDNLENKFVFFDLGNNDYELFNTRFTIVHQFIGIKDRFGKYIYEGDIIKSPYTPLPNLVVIYYDKFGMFALNDRYIDDGCLVKDFIELIQEDSFIEIVGNIIENRKLIL